MATLMEFAAASLDRDGGSRVGAGAAPHQAAAAPLLHWGSAGRKALDASGKRSVKLFVIATKGSGSRALDMAVDSRGLCREGVLILEELSMRGSTVSGSTPLDGSICSLWGTTQDGGLLILSLGATTSSWRGNAIAATLTANIVAERVVVADELPLRNCAIDVELDEDWETDCSLIRKLPTDAQPLAPEGKEITDHCPLLESGVVVDGVAAAALTSRQLRGQAGVVYVGLSREAPGSVVRSHVHEDPSYPLAALLRAELSRAGFSACVKKMSNFAELVPSAQLGNLYL